MTTDLLEPIGSIPVGLMLLAMGGIGLLAGRLQGRSAIRSLSDGSLMGILAAIGTIGGIQALAAALWGWVGFGLAGIAQVAAIAFLGRRLRIERP